MASIYKRGKKKNTPYTIQYRDHRGKRLTVKGYTDKGLTEQLAARLEDEARLRRTGMVDENGERLAVVRQTPLTEHLDAFEVSLSDNSPKYVSSMMSQVRRIVDGAGFKTLGDVNAEAVEAFLRQHRKQEKFGHRTYNLYLQAIETFCNWCVSTKRFITSPVVGIERLNTAVDVRHARRALTTDEVFKLVDSARNSGVSIQRFSGEQRARLYLISYLTGLRRNELASLTPRSFALDATPATVTVAAVSSKHRRKDVLPLHPELVSMLRVWLKGMAPSEKLFPRLGQRKTWRMVKKDLERVGIAYETADGIADFHAAGRHTYITELLRNGASLPEAKELARHSDIKMTMRYTHIGIKDQARAVASLQVPKQPSAAAAPATRQNPAALHGRCISGGAEGHSVSPVGNASTKEKRQNSCDDKGFGVQCLRSSVDGKIGAAGLDPAAVYRMIAQGSIQPRRQRRERSRRSHSKRNVGASATVVDSHQANRPPAPTCQPTRTAGRQAS